ncbi:MAG: helix-turn-helix transcriptional regulator [Cohaesibacter sp.]|nr:helix-turn-helix transcriptional regulator [Cohaesibacter sp.]
MIITQSLASYLEATGETPEEFAVRAGVGNATVRRLLNGTTTPNQKTGNAILAATHLRVTPNNFFGLQSHIQDPDEVVEDV